MPKQLHIHRYAIVEELGSLNGAKLYSATRADSPGAWTLLNWTPSTNGAESQSDFLQQTRGWSEEGVESFVYKGDFCLAAQSRALLEAKAALLGHVATVSNQSVVPAPPAPPAPAEPQQEKTQTEKTQTELLEDIGMVRMAMENLRRVAPRVADRDLSGEAGELWQLGEQVQESRTLDRAHVERFRRCSQSIAMKILSAADTSVDPGRQDAAVQNAITQAAAAAGLALIDPPLSSNPADYRATVLPDRVQGIAGHGGGGVAVVECRGLRNGGEILQPARVRVWESPAPVPSATGTRRSPPPAPPIETPQSHVVIRVADPPAELTKAEPEVTEVAVEPSQQSPPKPKSKWSKWFGLASLAFALGGSLYFGKSYFDHAAGTDRIPHHEAGVVDGGNAETAIFWDPKSSVGFNYPRAAFQKVPSQEAGEVIRLKSAEDVIVSVTVTAVPPDDRGAAFAAAYRDELAIPGREVTYKSGIKQDWYVVSGFEGPSIFYRRVLNPRGYIAAMTISNPKDRHPSFNPAEVVATTFKVMEAKGATSALLRSLL